MLCFSKRSPVAPARSGHLWTRLAVGSEAKASKAARTGFSGSGGDWPFTIDSYDSCLRRLCVKTPLTITHCSQRLLRRGKAMVDYKIRVTPELVESWGQMLRCRRALGVPRP